MKRQCTPAAAATWSTLSMSLVVHIMRFLPMLDVFSSMTRASRTVALAVDKVSLFCLSLAPPFIMLPAQYKRETTEIRLDGTFSVPWFGSERRSLLDGGFRHGSIMEALFRLFPRCNIRRLRFERNQHSLLDPCLGRILSTWNNVTSFHVEMDGSQPSEYQGELGDTLLYYEDTMRRLPVALPQLEHLYFRCNRPTVDAALFYAPLVDSQCPLTRLEIITEEDLPTPPSIRPLATWHRLPHLERLGLCLRGQDVSVLISMMEQCTALESLTVRIAGQADDIGRLGATIGALNSTLREVVISFVEKQRDKNECKKLAVTVAGMRNLRRLGLEANVTMQDAKTSLPELINKWPDIEMLKWFPLPELDVTTFWDRTMDSGKALREFTFLATSHQSGSLATMSRWLSCHRRVDELPLPSELEVGPGDINWKELARVFRKHKQWHFCFDKPTRLSDIWPLVRLYQGLSTVYIRGKKHDFVIDDIKDVPLRDSNLTVAVAGTLACSVALFEVTKVTWILAESSDVACGWLSLNLEGVTPSWCDQPPTDAATLLAALRCLKKAKSGAFPEHMHETFLPGKYIWNGPAGRRVYCIVPTKRVGQRMFVTSYRRTDIDQIDHDSDESDVE